MDGSYIRTHFNIPDIFNFIGTILGMAVDASVVS
jgi:hypothetical protein